MGKFGRDEIEQAFQHYWETGAVHENWEGFANNFTQDVRYIEHVLGTMNGRESVRNWIIPIMEEYCELYTAYEWHTIDEEHGRALVYMQNRRDHPSGTGTRRRLPGSPMGLDITPHTRTSSQNAACMSYLRGT